jgi:release factor glutamine methyltransferase
VTLLEVLRRATGFLAEHGSSSPRLDAEVLLAHALGLRRLDLYLQFERPLSDSELAPYRQLIARRGKGEPVAYLVGHKEFMGLDFEVTPDVLVPNPDTEMLVQRAVEICRQRVGRRRVADVGTGSGCIAVAVAHFVAEAEVFASDVSGAALAVAARNCVRHGVEGRVSLAQGELLSALPSELDLVCANLPYLPSGVPLPAEVGAQPAAAVEAGQTGAELVVRLLEESPAHLAASGVVLAEIDPAIAEAVREVARRRYAEHRLHRDLGGHLRLLEAWEPSSA